MNHDLLNLNIVSGTVPLVVYSVTAVLLVYLLVRRPSRRWAIRLALGAVIGLTLGIVVLLIGERSLNLFGGPIGMPARVWVLLATTGVGIAVVNLWRSRWWRKVIAAVGIVAVGLSATVGINAAFGIQPTLGAFLHISTAAPLALPPVHNNQPPALSAWKPPADMPSLGSVGTAKIPATISGFKARDAGIYLPPAAQVKNPPKLPLMIMLMGQPGDPTPQFVQQVLDTFATTHHGLAPIVVVADQLGAQDKDPLCIDSSMGKVETYLTQDVLTWARSTLNVIDDPAQTIIAGYSNGGQCSISLAVKHPNLWHNILDISGEEYPGSGNSKTVLKNVFHGDQAAYDAEKPINIMKKKGPFPELTGVFTYGSADQHYGAELLLVAKEAKAAGINTTVSVVNGAGHGSDALVGGLRLGFEKLYPILGLGS